ncbi:unnamed protein product [Parascedosporium putredinis]|uniref:Fe2OG dioxygenase domain-containing protein n=1 Tax=Parascedosporium putredinis TaxID=1442378 RepID=A0A9P1H1H1_9PEZI|nr:unnamed protein product [Parascedosporium putredinis]CAI7993062.1 unnamed protein product [Parascedosporium putredinis]
MPSPAFLVSAIHPRPDYTPHGTDSMSIPCIDLSADGGTDAAAKQHLLERLRVACETNGFFQLTGHGVPQSLLDEVMEQTQALFALPQEIKDKYDQALSGYNRGYERLSRPPACRRQKFNSGPNIYPRDVPDPAKFKRVVDEYYNALKNLAERIFRLLCETLGVADDDGWIANFVDTPIAILRLLHYPPQPIDASDEERGIGAHTDFGAVTILLQDMVGGLQVWDRAELRWADVVPARGAFVVNLGNLMMRWTNDRYLSNLHRVINVSGRDRYSVPFFFDGNPDFVVECFAGREQGREGAKYPPITVGSGCRRVRVE